MADVDPEIPIIEHPPIVVQPGRRRSCRSWWAYPRMCIFMTLLILYLSTCSIWFGIAGYLISLDESAEGSFGTLLKANCTAEVVTLHHNSTDVDWFIRLNDMTTSVNITYYSEDFKQGDYYDCWITECLWNTTLPICSNTYGGFDAFYVYTELMYDGFPIGSVIGFSIDLFVATLNGILVIVYGYLVIKKTMIYLREYQ